MAGILPNEGENFIAELLLNNTAVDRGSNLELLLFTNTTISETTTAASLTEPSGLGYSRIVLSDGGWTITGDTGTYVQQTFTGGEGGFIDPVYGYAIVTTGITPKIIAIELDSNGPRTLQEGYTYKITPSITIA